MTVVYKVLVLKIDNTERLSGFNGDFSPAGEILFEAGSPGAGRLLGYAPGEVEAALVEVALIEAAQAMPQRHVATPEALAAAEAAEVPAGERIGEASAGEAIPIRRPRRTKAQIAADKAAAEAAAAAAPSEVPDPSADPDDKVYGEPSAPAPVAAAEPEAPAAAAPPGGWNPFAR